MVAVGGIGHGRRNLSIALDDIFTLYAAVSITDLKVSVTASTGMQPRHRAPPLEFRSMIMGLSSGSRGNFRTP